MAQDLNIRFVGEFIDNIGPALEHLRANSIEGLIQGLGLLAAAFAMTEIVNFISDAIEAGDALDKLSQKTGIAVEALSGLELAGKLADVSTEGMANGIKKLNKALADAQDPTDKQAYAFKSLGIATTDSTGHLRSANDVLLDLADVFKNSEDGPLKVAAAMQLMGKAGTDMIPLLNGGSEELKKITQESKDFGLVWSKDQTAAAAVFNDDMKRVSEAVNGAWQEVAKALLPSLVTLAEYFVEGAKEGGVLHDILAALVPVVEALVIPLKAVADIIALVSAGFNIAGHAIGGTMAAIHSALTGDFAGAKNIMSDMGSDIAKITNDYTKFADKLWSGAPVDSVAKKEIKSTIGVIGDLGVESKKNAESMAKDAEKIADEYRKAQLDLGKTLYAITASGKTSEVAWQNSYGAYSKFNPEQKETLLNLAKEIDLQTTLMAISKQRIAVNDKYTDSLRAAQSLSKNEGVSGIVNRGAANEIDTYLASVDKYLAAQREIIKNYEGEAKAKAEAALASYELNAKSDETVAKIREQVVATKELNQETEIWTNTIQNNRDSYEKLGTEVGKLNEWLKEGKISQDEYTNAMEKNGRKQQDLWKNQSEANRQYYDLIIAQKEQHAILLKSQEMLNTAYKDGTITLADYNYKMKQVNDSMRNLDSTYAIDQIDKLDGQIKSATASFEGMFSDYIFQGMQGNWQNLGDMTKKIIDQMVANMIAAKLQMILFGDVGSTPAGKTPASTGLFGGVLGNVFGGSQSAGGVGPSSSNNTTSSGPSMWSGIGDFFGGLFEGGGDVSPNKFYVTGEKGPEIFRPNVPGSIISNKEVNAGGTSNVNFHITAMDSTDVMRVLNSRSREIAQMVTQTNQTYNMAGA
jgi:hypothetical protein